MSNTPLTDAQKFYATRNPTTARETVEVVEVIVACELERKLAAAEAALATAQDKALEEVLRGLRSEDDSVQLRAIIASVEALKGKP